MSYDGTTNLEGFLEKQGEGLLAGWKRRWFEVNKGELVYYELEPRLGEDMRFPKGSISLVNIMMVKHASPISNKLGSYPFDLITKKRTYHLAASNRTEMTIWIRGLERLIAELLESSGKIPDQLN
jgi:hypothetical protein